MIIMTDQGLYCPNGDFYIDPKCGVKNAVITHAHSDHARKGSKQYFCTTSGVALLKARMGQNILVTSFPYGEQFSFGNVMVSFHPAGHILGSSQIRLECEGEVWVVSGDYKREADLTCEPFETIPCDVFITEATFGTPAFVWDKNTKIGDEIYHWWIDNIKQKKNSILFAYSLGKTQRLLNLLVTQAHQPIICHPAATIINDYYRAQGVNLAVTQCLSQFQDKEKLVGELLIVPLSFLQTPQAKIIGKNYATAFASGWMMHHNPKFDQQFLLSDHADWNDLLQTILESQAKRVYVQHRGNGALVRKLKSLGIEAYSDAALFPKSKEQLVLF